MFMKINITLKKKKAHTHKTFAPLPTHNIVIILTD